MSTSLGSFLGRTLVQVKSFDLSLKTHHRAFTTTISAAVAAKSPRVAKGYVPSPAAKAKIYSAVKTVFEADQKRIPRPLNAVQLYTRDMKGKAPSGLKVGQISALRREEFEKLSKARKEKYEKEAKKLQDDYHANKGVTETEKEKYKRPLTPFNFYVRDRFHVKPADMTAPEFMTALAGDYRQLTEDEKAKYVKFSQEDMTRVAKARAEDALREPLKKKRPLSGYNLFIQKSTSPATTSKERGRPWPWLRCQKRGPD